jgi:hypothetical protein
VTPASSDRGSTASGLGAVAEMAARQYLFFFFFVFFFIIPCSSLVFSDLGNWAFSRWLGEGVMVVMSE